jgi:hypothetical protein
MVVSTVYDLPVGKGRKANVNNSVLDAIVGGWSAGGILTIQSGMPGNLNIGGQDNARTASGGYDRPNFTGTSPYLDNPTPSRYFNLDSFVVAPDGQFGNVGRNSIIGPGIIGFDGEIHKNFKMPYKEGHILQFRLEAFNALNHPNWGMPSLNILAGAPRDASNPKLARAGFGVVNGTQGSMRQVQLGLKYSF